MLKNQLQILKDKSKRYFYYGYFAKIATKVTLATLVGFLTIYSIHFAIDKAFEKITNNIDELIIPNEKSVVLTNLFRDISKLNNALQEELAYRRKDISKSYFEISDTLFRQIDSLEPLFCNDSVKLTKINFIRENLIQQKKILLDFLNLKYEYGSEASSKQADLPKRNNSQTLLSSIDKKQLELIQTSNFLFQEIISILNEVEQEELAGQKIKGSDALITTRKTISKLNVIAVVFIGISLVLFILIITDLVKSNKLKKKLEIANQDAKDDSEAKQHFLSNMSHEIRTPLQSIYGYAEQAMLSPEDPINIDAIYKSSKHLLDVINDILDFSMITSNNMKFTNESFDPVEEIEMIVEALRPICIKKQINISFESNIPNQLLLDGDAFRLKQVLFNLVGNAVKFTKNGYVKVEASFINDTLIINVIDTGIGITKQNLSNLFTEYSQINSTSSRKYGGTGLGLNIAKRIVELQNGTIEVDSEVGKGTTFIISIPFKKTVKEFFDFSEIDDPIYYDNVYFADDDKLIRNLCSTILNKHNISHKTFKNGDKLIKEYKKNRVPVIFLDMRMPETHGEKICEELRKITPDKNELKIYALTAQAYSDEELKELLNDGYNGLINKPFSENTLLKYLSDDENDALDTNAKKLNIQTLIDMGQDKKEVVRLLDIVIAETNRDLAKLKELLTLDDVESLTLVLHKLAGRIGQIGSSKLSSSIREVEIKLRRTPQLKNEKENINTLTKEIVLFVEDIIVEKNNLISSNQ